MADEGTGRAVSRAVLVEQQHVDAGQRVQWAAEYTFIKAARTRQVLHVDFEPTGSIGIHGVSVGAGAVSCASNPARSSSVQDSQMRASRKR